MNEGRRRRRYLPQKLCSSLVRGLNHFLDALLHSRDDTVPVLPQLLLGVRIVTTFAIMAIRPKVAPLRFVLCGSCSFVFTKLFLAMCESALRTMYALFTTAVVDTQNGLVVGLTRLAFVGKVARFATVAPTLLVIFARFRLRGHREGRWPVPKWQR
jgi:hypothetical protein